MSRQPIDHALREKIITHADGPLSVEASAGTGKTTLMVQKILHLLAQNELDINQVVAITFTEKAAEELVSRLETELKKMGSLGPQDTLKHAPIGTIHAFCARLLRERPFAVKVDPNFEVLDPLAEQNFLHQCFGRWLQSQLRLRHTALQRGLELGLNLNQLYDLCCQVYRARHQHAVLPTQDVSYLPYADLTAYFKRVSALRDLAQSHCLDQRDGAYLHLEALYREMRVFFDSNFGVLTDVDGLGLQRIFLNKLAPKSAQGKQAHWDDKDILKTIKSELKALKTVYENISGGIRASLMYDLMPDLAAFLDICAQQKRERHLLDFDDLLIKTRDLLHIQNERTYFQHQFRFFLIDEFQDTDTVQTDIIALLSRDHRHRREPLFVVGDPKQSIYRFRGARVEAYAAFTQSLRARGEEIQIRQNFRSSPPLVDWTNRLFSNVFESAYAAIEADPLHLSHAPSIIHLKAKAGSQAKVRTGERQQQEATAIAQWVSDVLQDERPRVFDAETQAFRRARAGDMAVLFPRGTGIDHLEEAFRGFDVPFTVAGGSAFFARQEIESLIYVLKAVVDPSDGLWVCAALRGQYMMLDDQQLYQFGQMAPRFDYRAIPEDHPFLDDPVLKSARDLLVALHAASQTESIPRFVQRVLDQAHAFLICASRFHGPQACANLEKFFQLAIYYQQHISPQVYGFVQWCIDMLEGKSKAPEALLQEDDHSHVRLMTIHKSKGLEFPIVILCQLSGQSNKPLPLVPSIQNEAHFEIGLGSQGARFATRGYEESLEAEKAAQADEQNRLLYVAATRARDTLVISHLSAGDKASGFLKTLADFDDQGLPQVAYQWMTEESLREGAPSPIEGAVDQRPSSPLSAAVARVLNHTDGPPSVTDKALEVQGEGASNIASEESARQAPNTLGDAAASAMPRGHEAGARLGVMYHEIMAWLPWQWDDAQALSTYLQAYLKDVNDPATADLLLTWVAQTRDQPFWQAASESQTAFREYPLSAYDPAISAKISNYYIDLLYHTDQGWHLIDYKTDARLDWPHDKWDRYRAQIRTYAELFEAVSGEKIAQVGLYSVRQARLHQIE